MGSASPGARGGTVPAQGTPSPGCRDMPGTEHWGGVTRKAVTHRRTHHPWWPGGARITLERERDMGWGCPGGGCRVAAPPPAPRNAPEPHPQPWLAVLAIQSFQASRALWGQGEGVRGWFAPRGSGGPRGTCSGHPREWEQVPGEGVQAAALPRSAMIPVVLPPLPPRVAWGGVLPGCPGVRGVRGALASPWGHACPRCPARATGGHGSSRGWAPLGHAAEQRPNSATSPRDERCHHAATSRWHSLRALTFSATGPGGPAGPTFPGKPGGP